MFRYQVSFGLATVLIVSLLFIGNTCAHELENGHENSVVLSAETRPIVEVELNGDVYTVPNYEDVEYTDAMRKLHSERFDDVIDKFAGIFNMILERRMVLRVMGTASGVIPIALKSKWALKKAEETDPSPRMAEDFGFKMGNLLIDVISSKTETVLEAEQVKERINTLFEALKMLTKKSKTGFYLDWAKMRVNDELLTDYSAPAIKWVQDNGYGRLMGVVGHIANTIKTKF